MAINFRKQHPMQLVERMLCICNIKEIGVGKIEELGKEYSHFLLPVTDEEGTSYHEIDWEFCLFEATTHQFNKLFDNFVAKPKEETSTEESKIKLQYDDKPEIITGDKPKLII